MDGADVLVAIFRETESQALFFLKQEGVSRLDVLNYISHGISKDGEGGDDPTPSGAPTGADDDDEGGGPAKNPLEAYCTHLNGEAAKGHIDPLIGRTLE